MHFLAGQLGPSHQSFVLNLIFRHSDIYDRLGERVALNDSPMLKSVLPLGENNIPSNGWPYCRTIWTYEVQKFPQIH